MLHVGGDFRCEGHDSVLDVRVRCKASCECLAMTSPWVCFPRVLTVHLRSWVVASLHVGDNHTHRRQHCMVFVRDDLFLRTSYHIGDGVSKELGVVFKSRCRRCIWAWLLECKRHDVVQSAVLLGGWSAMIFTWSRYNIERGSHSGFRCRLNIDWSVCQQFGVV